MVSRRSSKAWSLAVRKLASDRQSGAAEIASRAAKWFGRAVASGVGEDELAEVACTLLLSQPAMAPLYRVANAACLEAAGRQPEAGPVIELGERHRLSLAPLLRRNRRRGADVMTYSWSSTVYGAIVDSRSKIARVFCSEARPGLEGVRLARSLARRDVSVTLVTDAALMARLQDVDLVVVGADAFIPGGFVNKVGTSALARLARLAGKPFFVVAETSKILPRSLARFYRLPLRSGQEIVRRTAGVRVENPYFDYTASRFATGVITEKGEMSTAQLNREMRLLQVSARLIEALERRSA